MNVCADAIAYSTKVSKGERRRREEDAKREARVTIAERAWDEANRSLLSSGAPGGSVSATLRLKYKIDERLAGGTYRLLGDKMRMRIVYCLPSKVFDAVTAEIRTERERSIESLRDRFAEVESLIQEGRLDAASNALTALEIDVVEEELEHAVYDSSATEKSRQFYVWLIEWGDVVEQGPDFVDYMTERAEHLIEQGHLNAAGRYLKEALEVDREDEQATALRREIQGLRGERAMLLRQAEKLAATGRFDGAGRKLEKAAAIDRDDPVPLEELAKTIDGMRAEYLQYNPRISGVFYTAIGALGADGKATQERAAADTGLILDSSPPFNFGGGADFRRSRFVTLGVTGSFGVSNDSNLAYYGISPDFFYLYQLTGGVNFRTPRSGKRKRGFRFGGGVVWESVSVGLNSPSGRSSSDSQTAFFVKFALEFENGTFFVQHGLGFDDVDDSLIGWSNTLQIGGGWVF